MYLGNSVCEYEPILAVQLNYMETKMRKFKLKQPCPTEHQEQAAFMSWLARFHPDLYKVTYHIPNGRTSAAEGAKYKAIGARSGVPDICVAAPNRKGHHGLYIEFKRICGGIVSPAQKTWISNLLANGYMVEVANGFEEATSIIERYLHEYLNC